MIVTWVCDDRVTHKSETAKIISILYKEHDFYARRPRLLNGLPKEICCRMKFVVEFNL